MLKTSFLTDRPTLRKRARQHIDEGSVTAGYSADREMVLKLLNDSLATELVCVLRYRRHYFMARGDHDPTTRRMMEGILAVEEEHADDLADLLVAFSGESDAKKRSKAK